MKSEFMQVTADMRIEDSHDVRTFAQVLRHWAETHRELSVIDVLAKAESRGMSASELILGYASAFKELLQKHSQRLPENLRALLPKAIKISEDSVNLESYTYGKAKY